MRVSSVLCALAVVFASSSSSAEPFTKVFINGRPTPVYFNDGDSFKPQSGPYKGSQSRLSGFNTLESFGPVHSWGTWTPKEMWVIAKMSTHNARHGVWHCTTDGAKDGYGRLLMFCKDLAKSHIEQGLAMVMSATEEPGDPDLIAAQQEAIASKRGMWAHGAPKYVLSSLHSIAEGGVPPEKNYNRLISTRDGHSDKWLHQTKYDECQKVCHMERELDDAGRSTAIAALRADADAATALEGISDVLAARWVDDFVSLGSARGAPDAKRTVVDRVLSRLLQDGSIKPGPDHPDSCQVYVDYRRRFGGDRAVCLR